MVDAKKTIEKLRGEADRETMSFYVSRAVFNDFRQACKDVSPSRVLEELMREFTQDANNTKKRKLDKPDR